MKKGSLTCLRPDRARELPAAKSEQAIRRSIPVKAKKNKSGKEGEEGAYADLGKWPLLMREWVMHRNSVSTSERRQSQGKSGSELEGGGEINHRTAWPSLLLPIRGSEGREVSRLKGGKSED